MELEWDVGQLFWTFCYIEFGHMFFQADPLLLYPVGEVFLLSWIHVQHCISRVGREQEHRCPNLVSVLLRAPTTQRSSKAQQHVGLRDDAHHRAQELIPKGHSEIAHQ